MKFKRLCYSMLFALMRQHGVLGGTYTARRAAGEDLEAVLPMP